MALDAWETASMLMDDKETHCGICRGIVKQDPNRKQREENMYEHLYKRHRKTGYLAEVIQVYPSGIVDVYHIQKGAYSFIDISGPSDQVMQQELERRQKYWRDRKAPMTKVRKARKAAEDYKAAYNKLTQDEKSDLTKYQIDSLLAGLRR